MRFMDV